MKSGSCQTAEVRVFPGLQPLHSQMIQNLEVLGAALGWVKAWMPSVEQVSCSMKHIIFRPGNCTETLVNTWKTTIFVSGFCIYNEPWFP